MEGIHVHAFHNMRYNFFGEEYTLDGTSHRSRRTWKRHVYTIMLAQKAWRAAVAKLHRVLPHKDFVKYDFGTDTDNFVEANEDQLNALKFFTPDYGVFSRENINKIYILDSN